MLITLDKANQLIKSKKALALAGEEDLLAKLDAGNWIGGTIPYFMDKEGGIIEKNRVFATVLPDIVQVKRIKAYKENELSDIPQDAPEQGFSLIIIPASSKVHLSYAQNAPNYTDIFLKPIIGWISGVHLDNLNKITPKIFNGTNKTKSDQTAIVMHCQLPKKKMASIGIINLFKQGRGDTITFSEDGFSAKECFINDRKQNFAEYINKNKLDIKLPLVANYCGTMVNVSFQNIVDGTVNFYAPIFKNIEYRHAAPVKDYVKEFTALIPRKGIESAFSCNCILNFLYSELEGKKTGTLLGPMTFGEVAYQLLNQTLVYLEIVDV